MTDFLTPPQLTDVHFNADHPLNGYEQAVHDLRCCGYEFHRRGWSLGTSSNYSVVVDRDPLRLVVTASGKHKENLRAEDFVLVDSQGSATSPGQPKSSAETLLHCVVAEELPWVGAILHTHSVWATVLSGLYGDNKGFSISGFEMLKGLDGISTHASEKWIDIFPNTQDMSELSDQVLARLRDSDRPLEHGYLIGQHGLYTWGRNVNEARRQIEVFEFLFECHARKAALSAVL